MINMKEEFRKIVTTLAERFSIPTIEKMFFSLLYEGGQPRNAEFMAMGLEGGAAGIRMVKMGVDVVGGRMVTDSDLFFSIAGGG